VIQLGLAGVASALDARQYWRLLAACGGHFHAAFRLSKIRPQGAHLRIYSHSIVDREKISIKINIFFQLLSQMP
jgi:hypothetical protein